MRAHALALTLLDRYGVLTRGAVAAEAVPGGFATLYKVLSTFEDAGRCQRGYFVESLGGAQFAVCMMSTRNLSGVISRANNTKTDDVYAELTSNLIGNARMVPAGIVAFSRAQEHGYSVASVG